MFILEGKQKSIRINKWVSQGMSKWMGLLSWENLWFSLWLWENSERSNGFAYVSKGCHTSEILELLDNVNGQTL